MMHHDRPVSASAAEDPVLQLRRDHTYLELLAQGFHSLADELELNHSVAPARIREGIELHRHMLIEVHQRKEQLLAEALNRIPGRPYDAALREWAAEHAEALKSSGRLTELSAKLESGDRGATKLLSGELRRESDRWTHHLYREEEQVYHDLRDRIPAATSASITEGLNAIARDASALEARLTSWTSSWGASSD
jgi:hemerythrin-like domain-containing protein